MSVAFTWNWRIRCKRNSLVDFEWYQVDLATGISRQVADDLVKELDRLGFKDAEVVLVHTIP